MVEQRFQQLAALYYQWVEAHGNKPDQMTDEAIASGLGIDLEEYRLWEAEWEKQPSVVDLKRRLAYLGQLRPSQLPT